MSLSVLLMTRRLRDAGFVIATGIAILTLTPLAKEFFERTDPEVLVPEQECRAVGGRRRGSDPHHLAHSVSVADRRRRDRAHGHGGDRARVGELAPALRRRRRLVPRNQLCDCSTLGRWGERRVDSRVFLGPVACGGAETRGPRSRDSGGSGARSCCRKPFARGGARTLAASTVEDQPRVAAETSSCARLRRDRLAGSANSRAATSSSRESSGSFRAPGARRSR